MDPKPSILDRVLIPLIFVGLLSQMSQQSMAQEAKNNVKEDKDPLSRIFEPRDFVGTSKMPLKYRLLKPLDRNLCQSKLLPMAIFAIKKRTVFSRAFGCPKCPRTFQYYEI